MHRISLKLIVFVFIALFSQKVSIAQESNFVSNKDYSEFVEYVKDSLIRSVLCQEVNEAYCNHAQEGEISSINWDVKYKVNDPDVREACSPLYYREHELLNRTEEFDSRVLIHKGVAVYPNEYVWVQDESLNKSWASFLTRYYFTHPYFEDFPVYGLNTMQIVSYMDWKYPNNMARVNQIKTYDIDLQLPKEYLEFTKRDYYDFYMHIRDSVVRITLGEFVNEYRYLITINKYDEDIDPPRINWKYSIEWEHPRIIKTLKKENILTPDGQVNNSMILANSRFYNYYNCLDYPDSSKRETSLATASTLVNYEPFSPIKMVEKDKSTVNFSDYEVPQLQAFYYWKKKDYPKKDVFKGFVPFYNWMPEEESDLEKLQKGTIIDSFYHFEISIPTIRIEVLE